jgi:tetratricopeptide (TPR) repeat protein
MRKRFFCAFILLLTVFSPAVAQDDANDIATIYSRAEANFKSESYQHAKEFYQYVLDHWPDDSYYAIRAQAGLVKANFAIGDVNASDIALARLMSGYADNTHLPTCLLNVAQAYHYPYRKTKDIVKPVPIYQHILGNWPQHRYAMWAQLGLLEIDLLKGNRESVDAGFDKLVNDYASHPEIGAAVCSLAQYYENLQNFEKAKQIYMYLLDHWPRDEYARWAQVGLAKVNESLKNEPGAQEAIDKLHADSNEPNVLADGLLQISLQYYQQAVEYQNKGDQTKAQHDFRQAIAVSETILNNLPASAVYTPRAYHSLAIIHDKFGDYQKAIQYCQNVVTKYPDFINACYVQFMIVSCYQKLESSGNIKSEEASEKICQACEKLLNDYPDCIAATTAAKILKQYQHEGE